MHFEYWEGELIVEGVPNYEEFMDALNLLREKAATWMRPIEYDPESGLSRFYLLTDLSGFRPGSVSGDEGKLAKYTELAEMLFGGAAELHKPEIKMGARCLSEMRRNSGRPVRPLGAGPSFSEGDFLAALGASNKSGESATLDEALAELDSLIGLEPVKQQVRDIVAIVQNRGKGHLPCLHMVFTGNPGTGKTEVARILGKVFAGLGILPKGNFVEVDRSDLVAKFVGHTAAQTKEAIEKAIGGVLFIDEAYSLGVYGNLGSSVYGDGAQRQDFGPEAIDMLVKQMENHRQEFICIMAGYPKEMETMIKVNPGLRDRIGFTIDFPDYDEGELTLIFEKMVADMGYQLAEDALSVVADATCDFAHVNDPTFGNARFMRKLAERVILKQNIRSSGMLIEECDVLAALSEKDFADVTARASRASVGFVTA